ncbi:NAD(P)H-quinone oxidoreductase [Jatrophihabitans telluris]|uniref:NAD(P)H-quinone oxidoreductase n=1 Tax=Jatrophihabitans telluris TaxID=2038343 RepID=A0ABY4QY68_9ACTN|nr:NAD(P)H-quinone oxidoreductase [Jatrophihabitans telluris]UQX88578.1 NAD(P)H-quinone oxidoreductase [Jatrophihabitans telluris]
MKAIVATEPGGPEVLSMAEVDPPTPGVGEVLLDVAATAVNRADLMQRAGNYPPPPGASTIIGLECSGTVAALGPGVTGWEIGDEVCALLSGGGYAEQVVVPVGQLMQRPDGLDAVHAAALPEVACTVWSMVFDQAGLAPGERFLVHGGSSGIGTMAIQLAKAMGAQVFTTAGTEAKRQACRELGADVAIDYRNVDFATVIADETHGAGVDVILDTIGAKYLPGNVGSLAFGGRIAVIGMQGGVVGELNLGALMARRGSIYAAGLRARPLEQKATIVAGAQAHVWPLIAQGLVRPIVHEVLPLAEAARAHRIVEASEHVGKVVLSVR